MNSPYLILKRNYGVLLVRLTREAQLEQRLSGKPPAIHTLKSRHVEAVVATWKRRKHHTTTANDIHSTQRWVTAGWLLALERAQTVKEQLEADLEG